MATVQIEKRRRGPFGWMFAILFWIFNAVMLLWLVACIGQANRAGGGGGPVIDNDVAIGAVFLVGGMWFVGAVILGLLMFATRGHKEITTIER